MTRNFTSSPVGNKTKTVKLTLKLGSDTHTGEGESTLLALQNLKKPVKIVSRGFLTIAFDGKETHREFRPQQLNRIFFSSPALQVIWAKQLSHGLTGVKIA